MIFGLVDVIVLQFPGNGFRLIVLFGTKSPAIHLDQPDDIRIDRSDKIQDLFHVPVGIFKISAIWNRKVEMPANTCRIPNVVQ
jgi:hypothetical protein